MSYNIVENGELKNIAGPSGGIVEGKPIYGERKQYGTNKKMPLAGQTALKYTIDRDGILTGSCHKVGQGYTAWIHMNGKSIAVFDNYGTESCSFDFPNVRVKAGDVIELTSNVPTTETTNFFWLNNIGVTPIVGVEPSIELQAQDTYSLEEIKIGTWIDGKPIYRKVISGFTYGAENISVNTGISNIATIIDLRFIESGVTGTYADFIYNGTNRANSNLRINKNTGVVTTDGRSTSVVGNNGIIIVEYTKTTD